MIASLVLTTLPALNPAEHGLSVRHLPSREGRVQSGGFHSRPAEIEARREGDRDRTQRTGTSELTPRRFWTARSTAPSLPAIGSSSSPLRMPTVRRNRPSGTRPKSTNPCRLRTQARPCREAPVQLKCRLLSLPSNRDLRDLEVRRKAGSHHRSAVEMVICGRSKPSYNRVGDGLARRP
jgi:hypothetical protein